MNIVEAKAALEANKYITREGSRNTNAAYFLSKEDGRRYLFIRTVSPRYGTTESPAVFDWDDLEATNWIASDYASDEIGNNPVVIH